jgi:hypothetical protein
MKLIKTGIIPIDLDPPDDGGDADAEAKDIDKGIQPGLTKVSEKDPAVVGEHSVLFSVRCEERKFP